MPPASAPARLGRVRCVKPPCCVLIQACTTGIVVAGYENGHVIQWALHLDGTGVFAAWNTTAWGAPLTRFAEQTGFTVCP